MHPLDAIQSGFIPVSSGGLEQQGEFDRQSPYDHIRIWLPPQLIRNVKAIEDGAGGIRPVGKFAKDFLGAKQPSRFPLKP